MGFRHAGVPVKLEVSKAAKDKFEQENVSPLKGVVEVVAPHVLFQIGPFVYVMPVLGWDIQSMYAESRAEGMASSQQDAVS